MRDKIWKHRTIIGCGMLLLFLAGMTCLYAVSHYPQIEFNLSSTNLGEPVCVFYADENMKDFDALHMVQDTINENDDRYNFYVSDIASLRIDFGTSSGTSQIGNMVLKTFFTYKEIPVQYIAACGFSPDVGAVTIEGDRVRIESIGADPYIVLGSLDGIESVFNWKKAVVLFSVFFLLIILMTAVVRYYQEIKKILSIEIDLESKRCWIVISGILLLAAIVRYFYHLDAWPCFQDDEFQTFGAAYGYFKTGTFRQWDFVNNCISNATYNRAWPYTILLANWIRIFGLSEMSCRAMSALLGLFFVASCIYITKQLFENIKITFAAVLIILSNSTVTEFFRYTRMYALLLPVCLWMVYFAFCALTKENHFRDNTRNGVLVFIKKNFDFHLGYVMGSLLLLYIGWQVHVNLLILCLGIMLFVFYKALSTKERKYVIVSVIIISLIALFGMGAVFYEYMKRLPILGEIAGSLRKHSGLFTNIHKEYFYFTLDEFGSYILGILFCVMYIVVLFKMLHKRLEGREKCDIMIFLGSIVFTTVVFFVFFTKRYYSPHYIIMLISISAMVYAVGYASLCQWKRSIGVVITVYFILAVFINIGRSYNELYTASSHNDFIPAYGTIAKYYDLETDIIPIAGVYTRTYYFSQVANHWIIAGLNTDNSMDTLMEFAEENPEGILSCEHGKLYHLNQGAKELMLKWSDRLAGQGVDSYNVELSHYHFIDGEKTDIAEEVDKYAVDFDREGQSAKILVDVGDFGEDEKILCVKVNVSGIDGEQFARIFQLRLPEDGTGCYQYMMPEGVFDDNSVTRVEIENSYAVYGNDILQEFSK